jgi:hypothetical protein
LHRCVRFHDTEYAVYGEALEGNADEGAIAGEGGDGDEGGVDDVIDATWREAASHHR